MALMSRHKRFFVLILAFLGLSLSIAFSTNKSPEVSRRNYIQGLAIGLVGGGLLLPQPAFADVTNRVASPAALRSVKRSQRQLKDLVVATEANDFSQVKAFLRTPPFADVRKNCFVLVRGAEGGPQSDSLQKTYKDFIASVEKIDSTASLGMRGRKIPTLQLSSEYLTVETSLNEFVKVAEEAIEVPSSAE